MLVSAIRENPIKSSISILTLVSMLIGTVLTVDSRYAKAADLHVQQQSIEKGSRETKQAIDTLRKQTLEDKIFEIELIPDNKRSVSDIARLNKYKRDIQNIDLKWGPNGTMDNR